MPRPPGRSPGSTCAVRTSLPHTLVEATGGECADVRAYKLGRGRWSYNQVELRLRGAAGAAEGAADDGAAGGAAGMVVRQASFASDVQFPAPSQDSAVCFNILLDSGHKLLAHVYLVYDQDSRHGSTKSAGTAGSRNRPTKGSGAPSGGQSSSSDTAVSALTASVDGEDGGEGEEAGGGGAASGSTASCGQYSWQVVTRKDCGKGCQGCILRPIQRFGRLGKRSWEEAGEQPGEAEPASPSASGSSAMKDPKYMYVAIDEACTHVDAPAFRLLAAVYGSDGEQLLGSAVSPPIRVLANNDVPGGAARIVIEAQLPAGWEARTAAPNPATAFQPARRARRSRVPRPRKLESGGPQQAAQQGQQAARPPAIAAVKREPDTAGTADGAAGAAVRGDRAAQQPVLAGGINTGERPVQLSGSLLSTRQLSSSLPSTHQLSGGLPSTHQLSGGLPSTQQAPGRTFLLFKNGQELGDCLAQLQQAQQAYQAQRAQQAQQDFSQRSLGGLHSWDATAAVQQQQHRQQQQQQQLVLAASIPNAGACVRSLAVSPGGGGSAMLPLSQWQAAPHTAGQAGAAGGTMATFPALHTTSPFADPQHGSLAPLAALVKTEAQSPPQQQQQQQQQEVQWMQAAYQLSGSLTADRSASARAISLGLGGSSHGRLSLSSGEHSAAWQQQQQQQHMLQVQQQQLMQLQQQKQADGQRAAMARACGQQQASAAELGLGVPPLPSPSDSDLSALLSFQPTAASPGGTAWAAAAAATGARQLQQQAGQWRLELRGAPQHGLAAGGSSCVAESFGVPPSAANVAALGLPGGFTTASAARDWRALPAGGLAQQGYGACRAAAAQHAPPSSRHWAAAPAQPAFQAASQQRGALLGVGCEPQSRAPVQVYAQHPPAQPDAFNLGMSCPLPASQHSLPAMRSASDADMLLSIFDDVPGARYGLMNL